MADVRLMTETITGAEKIEDIGFGGLRLVQSEGGFKFGVDAVLLADFTCRICPQAKALADLGTGNGIIPIIISHKNPESRITGIDVQTGPLEDAERSVRLNGLEDRINFINADISEISGSHEELKRRFDVVVTNPPYVEAGSGIANSAGPKHIARQETTADLECFIRTAAWMLKDRGDFFIVYRPMRMADLFYYCRKYGLEPKTLRMVTPHRGEKPNIMLLHCTLGAGKELRVLEELAVRETSGAYTSEINSIYER